MRALAGLAAGLIFGLGLTISGMINPTKVLDFLDIGGDWDPSLALVMAAAIPFAALGLALGRRRRPTLAAAFVLPSRERIDARLLAGAAVFGAGWGLAGFCPGPALASLGLAAFGLSAPGTLVFAAAMGLGMVGYAALANRKRDAAPTS